MRRPIRAAALAACLAALTLAARPAAAAPVELLVDAFPLLDMGASMAVGWNEIVVSVQNAGARPARGRIEVSTTRPGYGSSLSHDLRVTAPFSAGAGATVNVRVPTQVASYGDVTVEVMDDDGAQIAQKSISAHVPGGAVLLDVSEVSRLRAAVNEAVITPLFAPASAGSRSAPVLAVGSPRFDPATGDPMLPDRAALYASVDAVLMRSDVLARLGGAELDALAGYVLAGGTLAVAVARPEDLRHPTLAAFAGGPISRRGVAAATLAGFSLPSPPTSGLVAGNKIIPPANDPSGELAEVLVGVTGGNLHGSLYGSSAAYGLGEVHVLAFDPSRRPAVDDPWAQARVVDMARRAYDRRSTQVFRPGAEPISHSYTNVRRELDPNEGSRWAVAAAALLLIAYAVLAGPVSFSLAAKAGRPLRALRRLPLFAAIAFALVLGIGMTAKGITGRARHLTLIEAGAGMPKGSARRFRGFYAARGKELTVHTTDASSVLSTAVVADYADRRDHLLVDRDGARLVEVAAMPWQTVVVREDGFASVGDGISLVDDGPGGIAVVNRSGHDLRGAVLRVPSGEAYYFPRIKDGDRASSATARKLGDDADGRMWETMMTSGVRAGWVELHRLVANALKPVLEPDAPGLSDAWGALQDVAGDSVDWFPTGVPALIGQLDGGEGRLSDAGLLVDRDRVLVRVLGYGGRP
jgi:hypothetical protein